MKKIFTKTWFWILLGIAVLAFVFRKRIVALVNRLKNKDSNSTFLGSLTEPASKHKPAKPLKEIPKEKATLINSRTISRNLLKLKFLPDKGKVPEFELTDISVAPGEEYGVFEPDKNVAGTLPVFKDTFAKINDKLTDRKYTFLRVNRNGVYLYIALDNAGVKNSGNTNKSNDTDQQKRDKEQAKIIAKALHDEINKIGYDVGRINRIIDQQKDEMLKLIAKAYEKMFGKTLITALQDEYNGATNHEKQIRRLQNLIEL